VLAGGALMGDGVKGQFCNTSHLLIDRSRNTQANQNSTLSLSHHAILVGELNDLSLDDSRALAVFSNAASALRSIQSGVSP
jgi:hypothetical protein